MYKNARAMVALLRGQMIDWIHSPRTLIMGIIILLLTLLYANGYKVMLQSSDLFSYFGESFYVYLSSGFGNITLTSAMFLIMVSEIPDLQNKDPVMRITIPILEEEDNLNIFYIKNSHNMWLFFV